jgi:hypothetical protein
MQMKHGLVMCGVLCLEEMCVVAEVAWGGGGKVMVEMMTMNLSPNQYQVSWKHFVHLKGIRSTDHATPLYPQKLTLNFIDKWRSISRYSSLAD